MGFRQVSITVNSKKVLNEPKVPILQWDCLPKDDVKALLTQTGSKNKQKSNSLPRLRGLN